MTCTATFPPHPPDLTNKAGTADTLTSCQVFLAFSCPSVQSQMQLHFICHAHPLRTTLSNLTPKLGHRVATELLKASHRNVISHILNVHISMELYSLGTREYDPFDQTIQVHAHAKYIPGALFPLPLAPGQGNEIRGLFTVPGKRVW